MHILLYEEFGAAVSAGGEGAGKKRERENGSLWQRDYEPSLENPAQSFCGPFSFHSSIPGLHPGDSNSTLTL